VKIVQPFHAVHKLSYLKALAFLVCVYLMFEEIRESNMSCQWLTVQQIGRIGG